MDVEQLNALMFAAEGQEEHGAYGGVGWYRFLDDVLADEFEIRRSAAERPLEDRIAFLRVTRDAERKARWLVPGSTRVWQSGSLAAVVCVVQVEGRGERFTNIRLFTSGGKHGWICTWWQVTAAQAEPS